jgi:hypothetical protein
VVPDQFSRFIAYAAFGWLPAGYKLLEGGTTRGSTYQVAWRPSLSTAWYLLAYPAGGCQLTKAPGLMCKAYYPLGPLALTSRASFRYKASRIGAPTAFVGSGIDRAQIGQFWVRRLAVLPTSPGDGNYAHPVEPGDGGACPASWTATVASSSTVSVTLRSLVPSSARSRASAKSAWCGRQQPGQVWPEDSCSPMTLR